VTYEEAGNRSSLLADFCEGLLLAHEEGLVHGELGPAFVVWDEADDALRLVGLRRVREETENPSTGDLKALGRLLAMAGVEAGDETLGQLLQELEASPSRAAVERIVARLRGG
jgi:tRNA A-37 threonylcarbamoyl transferase component Bud32